MYWLDKLREIKSNTNETYKSLAQKTGIPQTTIEKLFSGRTNDPKMNTMNKILACMGHSLGELLEHNSETPIVTDEELKMINVYRGLDLDGRRRVRDTVRIEGERAKTVASSRHCFHKIYYDFPVSAGTGEYLDNRTAVIAELEDEPPHGTDFILRIAGDSMEPEFHDGDYIYVNKTSYVNYGEIGVFSAAGNVYMKEYTTEGLRSLNPAYKLIPGSADIHCLGKVLGIVTGGVYVE